MLLARSGWQLCAASAVEGNSSEGFLPGLSSWAAERRSTHHLLRPLQRDGQTARGVCCGRVGLEWQVQTLCPLLNVVLFFEVIKYVDIFLCIWVIFATVRGEWTPLVTLAEQCGYTIERQDADVLITAPFITCGITVQVTHCAGGNGLILKYCIELYFL